MTTYRVGLTLRDGAIDGWVFDLPGCRAIGLSVAEAVDLLPVAIAEHLAWLKGHDESVPDPDSFDFEVIEEVESNGEFCFAADAEPLTRDEVDTAIRRMGYSLADIIAISEPLPQRLLEWRPPGTSVRADERVPDPRTIREMLEHAAGAETHFLRNIIEPAPSGPSAVAGFVAARAASLAHFAALDLAASGNVVTRQGPRGEAGWSARKVLRRIINHQRFHTREVQQRLCWLALGVPEVIPASRE
ncbi:MAG: hypothetical protein GEU75_02500 [Dehalococcoidia bacterium]|nr:hypothetical protein [Dehalococcoidia bacterium]